MDTSKWQRVAFRDGVRMPDGRTAVLSTEVNGNTGIVCTVDGPFLRVARHVAVKVSPDGNGVPCSILVPLSNIKWVEDAPVTLPAKK